MCSFGSLDVLESHTTFEITQDAVKTAAGIIEKSKEIVALNSEVTDRD